MLTQRDRDGVIRSFIETYRVSVTRTIWYERHMPGIRCYAFAEQMEDFRCSNPRGCWNVLYLLTSIALTGSTRLAPLMSLLASDTSCYGKEEIQSQDFRACSIGIQYFEGIVVLSYVCAEVRSTGDYVECSVGLDGPWFCLTIYLYPRSLEGRPTYTLGFRLDIWFCDGVFQLMKRVFTFCTSSGCRGARRLPLLS